MCSPPSDCSREQGVMSHSAELLVGRHNCWHEMSAEESRASRADHLSRVFAFMMARRTQYTFPSLKVSLLMIHLLTRPRQCFACVSRVRLPLLSPHICKVGCDGTTSKTKFDSDCYSVLCCKKFHKWREEHIL